MESLTSAFPNNNLINIAAPLLPVQTEKSAKLRFANHTLTHTPDSLQIIVKTKGDCSICLCPIGSQPPNQIQMLSCQHIYHHDCIQPALARKKECPDCRVDVKESDTKVYGNTIELISQLPKQCSQPLCTVRGTEQEITENEKTAGCPATLSTFPYQKTDQFLENNSAQIIEWLNDQFMGKNYSMPLAALDKQLHQLTRPNIHRKPAICLTVQYAKDHQQRELYYSAVDINKGNTPEACFKNLLLDLRTDLMMIYLRKSYPAIFNQHSELFIDNYDLWDENKIYLNNREESIPLTTVFNPETKQFSWDKFKEEVEKLGLSYRALFSTQTPMHSVCSNQSDGGNTRGKYMEEAPEIPSGTLDTDNFLF